MRCLLLMLFTAGIFAAAGDKGIWKDAESACKAGEYDRALELYEGLEKEYPENKYLYFNKGVVKFNQENYEEAGELFMKCLERNAVRKNHESWLEAAAFAGAGNAAFFQSKNAIAAGELDKAEELCAKSISAYKSALAANKDCREVATSIETAGMLMKKILAAKYEAAKQKQQQQKMKQEMEKLADKQEKAAEKTAGAPKDGSEDEKLKEQQKELSKETQELMSKMNDSQQDMKEVTEEQQKAEENLEKGKLEEAAENQKKAAEKLREIADKGEEKNEQEKGEAGKDEEQPGDDKDKDGVNQGEEQEKSPEDNGTEEQEAGDIINRERQDKQKREAGKVYRMSPVLEDW